MRSSCRVAQLKAANACGVRRPPTGARWLLGLCLGVAGSACTDESPYGRAPATSPRTAQTTKTAPSHGFGDAIAWTSLADGLARAAADHRPLMLVVHASWCHRCKEIKPKFSDRALVELSQRFVMVNVDQDEEPEVLRFSPDGDYIPRIIFVDPATGAADASLINERRATHHFYYGPRDNIVAMMRKALVRLGESDA